MLFLAALFPDQLSRTVSLGQSVDLLSSKAEADWTKDGEPHRHQLLQLGRRLHVSSALPGDAGLYVLNFGRLGKQAMRLVVRGEILVGLSYSKKKAKGIRLFAESIMPNMLRTAVRCVSYLEYSEYCTR